MSLLVGREDNSESESWSLDELGFGDGEGIRELMALLWLGGSMASVQDKCADEPAETLSFSGNVFSSPSDSVAESMRIKGFMGSPLAPSSNFACPPGGMSLRGYVTPR